jgi:DNA invertase Pin-like site-specific DNA recombinase
VLVVAKFDRLSRSSLDFASLLERARKGDWQIIAIDMAVDTTTPEGEMLATVLMAFAQFERRLIGQRTKDALAVKRAQGVKLGRPSGVDPATVEWVVNERDVHRQTWDQIATSLGARGIPTGQRGRWHGNTVRRIYQAATA